MHTCIRRVRPTQLKTCHVETYPTHSLRPPPPSSILSHNGICVYSLAPLLLRKQGHVRRTEGINFKSCLYRLTDLPITKHVSSFPVEGGVWSGGYIALFYFLLLAAFVMFGVLIDDRCNAPAVSAILHN